MIGNSSQRETPMKAMILHRSIRRRSSARSSWLSPTSAISSYSSDDIYGCFVRPFYHGISYKRGERKNLMEIRNKKKAGIVALATLTGISIIGSSVAYFTSTDTKDNPFTVGSVRTILHEDRWDDLADTDHNGIPDMAEDIIPKKIIPKDPTIENTGKNPAWVYLEVRVPIVYIITAQDDGSRNPKTDTELFLFTPDLEHWVQLSKIVEEDTDGNKAAVYVFGYETVLDPGQTTAELFTQVQFCNAIEEQGLEDTGQTITVKSMAIQQEESGTMEDAYGKFINQEHVTENDTTKPGDDTTDTTGSTTEMEGQDE